MVGARTSHSGLRREPNGRHLVTHVFFADGATALTATSLTERDGRGHAPPLTLIRQAGLAEPFSYCQRLRQAGMGNAPSGSDLWARYHSPPPQWLILRLRALFHVVTFFSLGTI